MSQERRNILDLTRGVFSGDQSLSEDNRPGVGQRTIWRAGIR